MNVIDCDNETLTVEVMVGVKVGESEGVNDAVIVVVNVFDKDSEGVRVKDNVGDKVVEEETVIVGENEGDRDGEGDTETDGDSVTVVVGLSD